MQIIRVGILGAGGIAAKLHLPELCAIPGVEVVVLAGRQQSRLETLCRKFQIPRWTQAYETVLDDSAIDAVVIAVPHPLHVQYGLAALQAGKHVLMQKPLSTSLAEADQFVQAATATGKTVLALPYVGRPHLLAARELVHAGKLGTVSSATARFSHGGPEVYYATVQKILEEKVTGDDLWFFDARRADVGALFDMGVYAIAHLVAVLGSVTAVTCRTATVAKPTTLEDTATLILDFASGALGTAETGWCDGARTYGFSIHGTEGKLVNPPLTGDLWHFRPSSVVDEDAPLVKQQIDLQRFPVENAHEHWIRCIRSGTQPELANASMARHVTEIMLRGLESSRAGRTIEVSSRCH
jgi:predicted dehydrogenase